jgi:hypothetical protein
VFDRIGGWVAILFGAFMGLGVLSTIGNGHAVAAVICAFLICSVVPIAGGVKMLGRARRSLERDLLRLAEARQGNLTVHEVVLATGLEPVRCEQLLDGLCKKGLADYRVADEGEVVYRLRPALAASEKAKARGLLE